MRKLWCALVLCCACSSGSSPGSTGGEYDHYTRGRQPSGGQMASTWLNSDPISADAGADITPMLPDVVLSMDTMPLDTRPADTKPAQPDAGAPVDTGRPDAMAPDTQAQDTLPSDSGTADSSPETYPETRQQDTLVESIQLDALPPVARFTASPASLDFPPTPVGQVSQPQRFNVINLGSVEVSLSTSHSNRAQFVVIDACNGATIGANGGMCLMEFRAAPTAMGNWVDRIAIAGGGLSIEATVVGRGVAGDGGTD